MRMNERWSCDQWGGGILIIGKIVFQQAHNQELSLTSTMRVSTLILGIFLPYITALSYEDLKLDETLRLQVPSASCPKDHTLACWTCRAEKSEEDCILHGRYQPCHDVDVRHHTCTYAIAQSFTEWSFLMVFQATCEYMRRVDDRGMVREVNRGCRSMATCQEEGEGCTTYDVDLTYCRDCRPGKRGLEHRCVPSEGICTPSGGSHNRLVLSVYIVVFIHL